ncbi:MAG: PIN domain-containing protein [Deltaproteobacteria bacterium]|nr:PIN domain-containing protein [Deltaproteobacteria bacterium]
MITAIDTSVLLDIFTADKNYGPRSKEALRDCIKKGRIIACEVVFAEVACAFPNIKMAKNALDELGIEFEPFGSQAAMQAGEVFKAYRSLGGKRERVIADFLIASHALNYANRLLTRDRGFNRTYFKKLTIIDPSQ